MVKTPHIPIENLHPDDRYAACCGFVKLYFEGAEIDQDIRAGYLKYMKDEREGLCNMAALYRDKELLHLMLAEKLVPKKGIHLLLEECC